MNPTRPRRLAFELLEPKSAPSSLLLAIAPLDEPDQRAFESESALYATSPTTSDRNVALLQFIQRNTRSQQSATEAPRPTAEQVATVDKMMQATDTDLRTMVIAGMLEVRPADRESVEYVSSVIQF